MSCFYFEKNINNHITLSNIIKRGYKACFRLWFIHPRCHIIGKVDVLIHPDSTSRLIGCPINNWMTGFIIHGDKISEYQEWKIKVTMRYFVMWWSYYKKMFGSIDLEHDKILIIHKTDDGIKYIVHDTTLNEKEHKLIKKQAFWIRHAKTYQDIIDIESDAPLHWRYMPNMRIMNDEYNKEKLRYAIKRKEISLLWYCSQKIRELAFSKRIFSFDDPRFFSDIVCTKLSSDQCFIIQKMLEINIDASSSWIYVHDQNMENLRFNPIQGLYIDFEYDNKSRLYLIGIYDAEYDTYTSLWSKDVINDEKGLIKRFQGFLEDIPIHKKCIYWYAEENVLKKACERHDISFTQRHEWIDLWKIFRYNPIIVRGAYNYSLKSITNAFNKQGLCPIGFDDLNDACANGQQSLVQMKEYYNSKKQEIKDLLEKYNSYDCKVMFYIYSAISNIGLSK